MLNQGIVLLNKPQGITSFTAVRKVRHFLNVKKAGHLGTLDPIGEGVLPIAFGKATRIFDYFLTKDKVYKTTFKFGVLTDTLDHTGQIIKTCACDIELNSVIAASKKLIGKYSQMPPIYSAKKINGVRACDLARRGEDVVLKGKEIEVYNITDISKTEKNTFEMNVHCSSGTYIRSIARDMGEILGTCGIMISITRTRCGIFELKHCDTLENFENGNYKILSTQDAFSNLAVLKIDRTISDNIEQGRPFCFNGEDGVYSLFCEEEFLGVCEVKNSILQMIIKLWENV